MKPLVVPKKSNDSYEMASLKKGVTAVDGAMDATVYVSWSKAF